MDRHVQRFRNNASEFGGGWRGKSRGLGSMLESVKEGGRHAQRFSINALG